MANYKNVAVAGKGLLGSAVVLALSNAGFNVTVLGRSESSESLPDGVKRVVVDYNSADSLEAAFRGQDVVVSTVSGAGIFVQKSMIDAAIKAGVKRFIPADYSSSSTDPAAETLPHYVPMVDVQNYLKSKSEAGLIEYTVFVVGAFTEYLVRFGFVIDWAKKTAEAWKGGDVIPISTTSVAGVGKAISGALKNADATKNRNIYVHEFVVTQKYLFGLAEKHGAPKSQWTLTDIDDVDTEFERRKALATAAPEFPNIIALLRAQMFAGKIKVHFDRVDNDLVGLRQLSEAEFDANIAKDFA
ncbi:NAD(P)-binding protein [Aaosphaeria arxii CBS 175.79]|uniref:NAD(P)-binding protein n=1 Tax=Aaosphaeria arxii CBS 175.79 TaxID=1450172 RepID=A0A6A5XT81_9PLEO|nr:NAD(P)-binding protein [Aaosphaeria arxii CBS 175.79]KAF2016153.1 NAD(P)-binding protein [Aaosphaeria arxii CBS 175.79]